MFSEYYMVETGQKMYKTFDNRSHSFILHMQTRNKMFEAIPGFDYV